MGGRELRKEFISQLRHPLEDRQFSVRINATWEDFLSTMADICGLITYAADVTSRDLFLAPYFLLNTTAFPIVKNTILKAEAFSRLYQSKLLQELFFSEWEKAVIAHMNAKSPTISNPLRVGPSVWLVGLEPNGFWSDTREKGSYYVYAGSMSGLDKKGNNALKAALEVKKTTLDKLRGGASDDDVNASVATYSKISEAIGSDPDWHELKLSLLHEGLEVRFRT